MFAIAGCTKDAFVGQTEDGLTVLSASVEGSGTKAAFTTETSGNFFWTTADKIAVWTGSAFAEFSLQSGAGTSSATFTGTGEVSDNATVIYPYSCASSSSTYTLPASYKYTTVDSSIPTSTSENSVSFNAPMYGTVSNGAVSFKHLAGVLVVNIQNLPNTTSTEYTVTVTSDKSLTGDFTITTDSNSNSVINANTASNNNTVTFTYTLSSSQASGVFYVPAPLESHTLTLSVSHQNNGSTVYDLQNVSLGTVKVTRCMLKNLTVSTISASTPSEASTKLESSNDVEISGISSSDNTVTIPGTNEDNATKTITFNDISGNSSITVTDGSSSTNTTPVENVNIVLPSSSSSSSTEVNINTPKSTTTLLSQGESTTIATVNASTADYTLIVGKGVTITNLNVKAGNVYLESGASVTTFAKDDSNTASTIYVVNATGTTLNLSSPFVEITPAEYELHKVCAKGGELTLTENVSGDFVVSASEAVTLTLGGYTVTNKEGDTFTVNNGSTLTINGEGTVDNVTHAKACIYNNGTVTLNGGSYTRSKEASTTTDSSNGNSYYNILNHGDLTIESGASITSSGSFSSLIDNGYYSYTSTDERKGYVSGTGHEAPTLTINGGTFSGGINTVKNDDNATLTISGGSLTNTTQAAVQNNNTATISGGTFESSKHAVETKYYSGDYNKGSTTITGGTFSGDMYVNDSDNATLSISGGTYSDPNALGYLAENASVCVKMAANVEITKAITMNATSATADLYFNGYTITNKTDDTSASAENPDTEGLIVSAGTLNLYDDNNTGGITCNANGNSTDGYREAVTVKNGATVNIHGGYFYNSQDTNTQLDLIYAKEGTINIYGGKFESKCYNAAGYWTLNCHNTYYANGTAKINVMGGTFINFNPSYPRYYDSSSTNADKAESNYVVDGYTVTAADSSNHTVDATAWYNPTTTDTYTYTVSKSSSE